MNMSIVKKTAMQVQKFAVAKSPTILTAIGVAGFLSTVVLAVKATPKVLDILEKEKKNRVDEFQKTSSKPLNFDEQDAARKLTNMEIVKLSWREYIPAAVIGAATIACIIGSNTINTKRQAALAGLYALAKESFDDYQKKVVEQIGNNKEEKVRESIDQDKLNQHSLNESKVIITGKGKSLFFDTLTSRYFESDIEEIRKCQNDFNYRMISDMFRSLNEWYDLIGLDPVSIGEDIGWKIDFGKLDIFFDTKLVDGRAVIVLNYRPLPVTLWSLA